MSITFTTDAPETTTQREEPCLCAQFAPGWCEAYEGARGAELLAELAAHASMVKADPKARLMADLAAAWRKGGLDVTFGGSVWLKADGVGQEVACDMVGRLPNNGSVTVYAGGRVLQLLASELA